MRLSSSLGWVCLEVDSCCDLCLPNPPNPPTAEQANGINDMIVSSGKIGSRRTMR